MKAGLLGHPVAHSLSPTLFEAALSAAGLEGSYEALDVPPEALEATIASLACRGWCGFNVTIPHKQAMLALVDDSTASAGVTGAVNCVTRGHDGSWQGHNTDAEAFLSSLREDAGFSPAGSRVLVLGAGGAARAVTWALQEAGARVEAAARRTRQAAQLPGVVGTRPWGRELAPYGIHLLVNCTPLGMARPGAPPVADPWAGLLAWDTLPAGALVVDLVYTPEETPLLATAAARGHPTLGGLGMLVRQAEAAFALWTGRVAPAGAMLRAARG